MWIIRRVVPGRVSARSAAMIGAGLAAVGLAVGLPLGLAPSGHSGAGRYGDLAPGPGAGLAAAPDSTATIGATSTTPSTRPTKVALVPGVAYPGVPAESLSRGVVRTIPSRSGSPVTKAPGPTVPARTVAWARQALPPGTEKLMAVACPNASTCWAVGYSGVIATTDGGLAWTPQATPPLPAGDYLDGVSCVDSVDSVGSVGGSPREMCWAVSHAGTVLDTADAGVHWSAQAAPGGLVLDGISCADANHCTAVSGAGKVAATGDGGNTWAVASVCDSCDLSSVSCPTAGACWVGGTTAGAPSIWVDEGAGWAAQPLPVAGGPGSVGALSCSSSSLCTAVGEDPAGTALILATSDGGASWTRAAPPAGAGPLTGVSCGTDGACRAVGGSVIVARPSLAAAWTFEAQTASVTFQAVSCVATGRCVAAGSEPAPPAGAGAGPPPGVVFARSGG